MLWWHRLLRWWLRYRAARPRPQAQAPEPDGDYEIRAKITISLYRTEETNGGPDS